MRTIETRSPEELRDVGAELARDLRPGDVLGLIGDLGAGKTELVKGIARGLGLGEDEVTSPTFTLVQTYRGGRMTLHHVDLYRLEDPDELVQVGLDDLYRDDDAVTAVEWFDRFAEARPDRWTEIRITESPAGRVLTVTPRP